MKTLIRTITADSTGKILFLKVDNTYLSIPWQHSRFYAGEKVNIVVTKDEFIIKYLDKRMPSAFEERNWAIIGKI